jgi:ankyrin repeat protein
MRFVKYGLAALALGTTPLAAQTQCDEWGTPNFFRSADLDQVRACLAQGADPSFVNERSADRWMPLHYVAGGFFSPDVDPADLVALLIEAGADPSVPDFEWNHTPLHIAVQRDNSSVDIIRALIAGGADISATTPYGYTPLHHAAHYNSDADFVIALLEAGADPSVRSRDGNTPLHGAAGAINGPSRDVVMTLLKAGADAAARNESGETPLHSAVRTSRPNLDVVMALLEFGADVVARNERGETPLHYAAQTYQITSNIVMALLNAGADPLARDSQGQYPIDEIRERSLLYDADVYALLLVEQRK